jgi:hypothetical protein
VGLSFGGSPCRASVGQWSLVILAQPPWQHSARVTQVLTYTDITVKKLKPEQKTALDSKMNECVETFQTSAKKIIIKAAKEDLVAFHDAILDKTVETIHDATATYMTQEGITGYTGHEKVWQMIHHFRKDLFAHHK